jgi:hypothetical protein
LRTGFFIEYTWIRIYWHAISMFQCRDPKSNCLSGWGVWCRTS